jgi:nucleotide-binding universal stress UspA family protein
VSSTINKKEAVKVMVEIKKILFPCDLMKNSSKILPYVLTFSEKYDSMIYLLHVVEDLSKWYSGFYDSRSSMDLYQNKALKRAEACMDKLCEEQLQNCPNFQRRKVFGDPATEILKTIDSEEIDLVIMGTHGHKGLEDTIFGSVAENVMKKSPVPVLVINPYKIR